MIGQEMGASLASLDTVEVGPRAEIPTSVSPIGKSLLITFPVRQEMDNRPMEWGDPSSGPSRQFAKKALKSVLGSWVETISSSHLDDGFGMIKYVQEMLSGSEEVGLNVTGAKAFVDDIIALGSKWIETENFTDDDFFGEMFLKPPTKDKSTMDEITWTKKQFV